MKKVALIPCVSKKRSSRARAVELYTSTLFKLSLQYARKLSPDRILILSAKYGLVDLDEEIEPYDMTLNKMRAGERKAWAGKVIEQLKRDFDLQHDHFIILAGERYRQYLLPHLASYEIPLKGLPIGKQLQFLKRQGGGSGELAGIVLPKVENPPERIVAGAGIVQEGFVRNGTDGTRDFQTQ